MTKNEITLLAEAVRKIALAPAPDQLTLRAIVQSLDATLFEIAGDKASSFKFIATGSVDLSGVDYVARITGRSEPEA